MHASDMHIKIKNNKRIGRLLKKESTKRMAKTIHIAINIEERFFWFKDRW